MLGAESVLGAMRATPVQLDMRPHWVETSMAEQLGLQDGQVVQALVEKKDGRVRLWLKDFSFDLPNGWVLKDGDKPFLRVSQNAGSWGFLIQSYPSGQTSSATPASAAFGINQPPVLNSAQTLPSTTLGLLLTQPTGFESFARMLAGLGTRNLSGQGEFSDMVKRLLQLPVVPRQDAADALGLAITHAHARQNAIMREGGAKATKQARVGQDRVVRAARPGS